MSAHENLPNPQQPDARNLGGRFAIARQIQSQYPRPKLKVTKSRFPPTCRSLPTSQLSRRRERKAASVGLCGRLAWDDDVTVRIYSPVAGRVTAIPVEVNQRVVAGDALALLDSPDFGQALANARAAGRQLCCCG